MTGRKRGVNTRLLDGVTADMLGGGDFQILDDGGMRVERILLEMVRPDPVQPRRVLPERIYHAFHSNRLTPTQALRELIQTAQLVAKQNGRPFTNVLEMLDDPDDDTTTEAVALSPEEVLVRDLVDLALTIQGDSQVNPLTVVDVTQGVTRLYRIETGERRYWASWLLRDFMPGIESDGMIPCIVIPAEKASPFRQAKENSARAGLSAIAMARQAALLLLAIHGFPTPDGPVNNDFYRQALDLDLRGHREYTAEILASMGGIDKSRFSQFKALLHLSDEALELADRHNLDEFRLRPILQLGVDVQGEMVQHVIQFNLTGRQVRELCEQTEDEGGDGNDFQQLSPQVKRFVNSIKRLGDKDEAEVVRGLLFAEETTSLARARIDATVAFLQRVKELLPTE